ncbi:superoxide dismutase [Candidatus Woesearchaeota archaeon]|nr:superoxide dismutase [Candidatus Woesearchaeota archaeon]
MKMHELPKLPYEYDALEPYIDAKTMEIHHTKHHQTYVDKLNAAIKGTKFESMGVNELLKKINEVPDNIKTAVRNHGGGHSNHTLFWQIMGPNAGGEPSEKIADGMNETFGSFEKFKEELTNAGLNRFGSGWAWLVLNNEKLEVYSTANQDSPLMEGKIPILGVDVWEHAMYLKYQNRKNEYIAAWWNVVNWNKVNELLEKAKK